MSTFTSTIPAAVATLESYMQTVAAATAVSDVNVYVGYSTPLTGMSANFLMVGDYEEGLLWQLAEGAWEDLPVAAKRRREVYSINGCIRTWAGGNDWQSRLGDAFSLFDALYEQVLSDPGGSGTLTPSGAWGALTYRNVVNGPLVNTGGYGVVIGFELGVLNAFPVG